MNLHLTEGHLQFCSGEQKKYVSRYLAGKTYTEIGEEFGLHRSNVKRKLEQVINIAAVQGYLPAHGINNPLPESMVANDLLCVDVVEWRESVCLSAPSVISAMVPSILTMKV